MEDEDFGLPLSKAPSAGQCEAKPLIYQLGAASFPSRGAQAGDGFAGPGVLLRPHACSLGPAGRQPATLGDSAQGVWRGTIEAVDFGAAAAAVAPLLAGTVRLDCSGTFATTAVEPDALRFVACARSNASDSDEDHARDIIGEALHLSLEARLGEVLSHHGHLFLSSGESGFDALLRLSPRERAQVSGASCFWMTRPSPMGTLRETWQEIPMIEHPRLLRLMMGDMCDRVDPNLAKDHVADDANSDEAAGEETLVVHCWRRASQEDAGSSVGGSGTMPGPLSVEQLLWSDAVAALAESPPCAEEPVPANRVRLSEEGVATRDELLGERPGCAAGDGVAREEAPRLASLAFLRQYVSEEALREDVLPKLFPEEAGCGGSVRVFSAELADVPSKEQSKIPSRLPPPRTLDDLFSDEANFRDPVPWAATDVGIQEDPLAHHELTSVMLLNDRSGFALSFHCLQAPDP